MSQENFDEGIEVLRNNLERIFERSVSEADARLVAAVVSMLISAGYEEFQTAHHIFNHLQNVENMRNVMRNQKERQRRAKLKADYSI